MSSPRSSTGSPVVCDFINAFLRSFTGTLNQLLKVSVHVGDATPCADKPTFGMTDAPAVQIDVTGEANGSLVILFSTSAALSLATLSGGREFNRMSPEVTAALVELCTKVCTATSRHKHALATILCPPKEIVFSELTREDTAGTLSIPLSTRVGRIILQSAVTGPTSGVATPIRKPAKPDPAKKQGAARTDEISRLSSSILDW